MPDTKRPTFSRLPIFACASFIAFLFLASIWNFAVERDWPKLRIRSAAPLSGLARTKPAPWSVDAFLSGETQKAVSNNFTRALPIFPIAVRARNQFVFSLFGFSPAPGVVIGRDGQLFEQIYIDEFCRRGAAPNPADVERWADSIREIQKAIEGAGKSFVYLISPSKAARYSEDLPATGSCAAQAAAGPDKLAPYLAALAERDVRYVDGAGLVTAKRAAFEVPLFARGATHWNALGAALALREITAVSPSAIGRLDFVWRETTPAIGWDRDLLDMLNLLWPDAAYPTAIIERAVAPQPCARAPALLALGGSFLHPLLIAAMLAACPPGVDYWFYMRTENNDVELWHDRRAPGDVDYGPRLGTEPGLLAENLRKADLVILEENESRIGESRQVEHLLAAARVGLGDHAAEGGASQ
jgi:hypothetical protein